MSETEQSKLDTIEQKIQEVLSSNLLNNTFASVALEDPDACQYVLQKITGIEDLKVTYVKGQHRLLNLTSKESILDVYAEDSAGRLHNVEIQRKDTVDHPHRTRYYSSMLDKSILDKGDDYSDLPEVHVIYISETDILNTGKPISSVEKYLGNSGVPYDDGSHITYANTEVDDGSEIAKLMQYFKTADPNDMRFGALSRRVRFLKTEKGGHEAVNDFFDTAWQYGREEGIEEGKMKGKEEGRKEGKAEGVLEAKQNTAKKLFTMHNSVDNIAEALEVDVAQVESWLGLARA